MQLDTIEQLLVRCLELAASGGAGSYIENPAIQFETDAKTGKYDHLTDSKYEALLDETEKLARLWEKQSRRTAGELLLAMLRKTFTPHDYVQKIAAQIATWYDDDDLLLDKDGNPLVPTELELAAEVSDVLGAAFSRRPSEIRDAIAARVIGQPDAVKAAAMVVHGQLAGRRTNAVFAGPSGCGKSEIWRCLSKEYPGLVRMIDASRMCGEGWNGSVHLRDVFDGVANKDDIRSRGLIVVLDEADKVMCETAISSTGNNHNHVVQNNMLKMLDGDVIEFGAEHGQPAFSVDCGNVSVVMLGAFENLLKNKAAGRAKPIGFGESAEAAPPSHADISYEDMINAGTRREIAGRINKIVALSPLDAAGYRKIIKGPALSDLERDYKCRITLTSAAVDMLSEQAEASGLGVRWAKSAMRNAIDDAMFDTPDAAGYFVGMRDGKLYCRAAERRPSEAAIRESDFRLDEPVPA